MRSITIALALLTATLTCAAQETNIVIKGYHDGEMTFNQITNAAYYRIDWAPRANGPWSQSWEKFQAIPPCATNDNITLLLPKFYRVTAVLKNALSGLIMHYTFHEQPSGPIPDKACPGNYAESHGAVWVGGSTAMGGALSFDGVDDYLDLGSSDLYQQRGRLSGCAWIYRTARHMCFLTNYRGGSAYNGQFEFVVAGNGRLCFSCGQGPGQWLFYETTASDLVASNEWHHVAFTYDEGRGPGNKVRLFLDGARLANIGILGEGAAGPILQTSDHLRLMMNNASPQYPWPSPGMIHEIMLFDRTLSDDEVKQIYEMN